MVSGWNINKIDVYKIYYWYNNIFIYCSLFFIYVYGYLLLFIIIYYILMIFCLIELL